MCKLTALDLTLRDANLALVEVFIDPLDFSIIMIATSPNSTPSPNPNRNPTFILNLGSVTAIAFKCSVAIGWR